MKKRIGLIALSLCGLLLTASAGAKTAPQAGEAWTSLGALNTPHQLNVQRCNYRVAVPYMSEEGKPLKYTIAATSHVTTATAGGNALTLMFQMDYTDVAFLAGAHLLSGPFFQAYSDRFGDSVEKPFAPLMTVFLGLPGNQPYTSFFYRYFNAQYGGISGPTENLDGARLMLEQQCP